MNSSFRSRVLCVALGLAAIAFSCARVSKEPEKASSPSQGNAHEPDDALTSTPPARATEQAVQAPRGAAESIDQKEPAEAAVRKRGARELSPTPSRATAGASRREAEAASKAAPAPYPPAQDAVPTLVETPELHAALAEFDTAWQHLSASRACEDACRALESMRRSAQRICDLVVASDPNQRCRTAHGRLDQASRDLAARCSGCR
ncbi:MAG TPA: hypothetical protein VKP30_09230 [Polyangiaceae bacterium]|nr:hypothetical protein [Polyangiaceae bacterium]